MTFLEPLMALGGLAAIPVVLLYLIRQVPIRRVIPSILLWEGIPGRARDSVSWRRVRRWLSLLLQLLFVLLVVLALCRPEAGRLDHGKATVLVLDNSASLAAGSRVEELKEAASHWLDSLPAGTPVALLTTAPSPGVLLAWTADRESWSRTLGNLPIADQPADPEAALRLAAQLAGSQGGRVVMVTDGVGRGPFVVPDGVIVSVVGGPEPNSGITTFSARRSPAGPDDILLLAKTMVAGREGKPAAGRARLILERGGRVVDARDVAVGESPHEWTFPAEGPARFTLRLEPADSFPADNAASLEVAALPPVDVLFVSEPDPVWEAALEAVPGVRVTRVWPPDSLRFGDPSKVAVFRGAVPPEGFQSAGLVLVNPGKAGIWGKPVSRIDGVTVDRVAADDPLMRFVNLEHVGIASATGFEIPPMARVFAGAGAVPLIYGHWEEAPRWLVVAFDPGRSDWLTRASFPVFLANLLDAVRGETGGIVADMRLNPALTSLTSHAVDSTAPPGPTVRPPGWPLWWWLLAMAAAWLLVEWGTFHRRLTE